MTFNVHRVKQEICEIGARLYQKGFAAANDGNITYRIGLNEVLCTPTMHCKGFLKPEDLCLVDMNGQQISGRKKRTSEVLLHLEIMKARPEIKSVVHCHPPHATAFAVAREPIPQCVLPEVEIFLGDVPIAPYQTPGGKQFAETILPFVHKSNIMILSNHGTVSYGETVERAYWWTEILDSYCRILMLARSLGHVSYITADQERQLLDLKEQWGFKDPRNTQEYKNCDICGNDIFRASWAKSGVQRRAFEPPPASASPAVPAGSESNDTESNGTEPSDQEAIIQIITDRVMAALSSAGSKGQPVPSPNLTGRRFQSEQVRYPVARPRGGCRE
ncbi:MAG: fructose-bisphosphate aldolase [Planctomycetes bacterium RBG_16_64_10]|nr:MAG: fructose-bisphosphate aldolase [Planctomycetes bacterium RBG_16_64_10]